MRRAEHLDQVAVFGGLGNMGGLTARLFRNDGYERIVIVDPKDPSLPTAAEAIASSRILFFSAPPEVIPQIIIDNESLFNERHIVLDNATIKRPLKEAYQRLLPLGVSIYSTHPGCKHDQPPNGQPVFGMPVGDNAAEAKAIGDSIYKKANMRVIDLDFNKHDATMLVAQIPHIVQRVIGRTLEKMEVDMQFLPKIATANFTLYWLSLWRTLVQDPAISALIVSNFMEIPEGQDIIDKMRTSFEEVVDEKKDRSQLATDFGNTYVNLDGNEIGPAMNELSITVLEALSDMEANSMTLVTTNDEAGSLRRILLPFEEKKVNIFNMRSHRDSGALRFDIALAPGTEEAVLEEVASDLKEINCSTVSRKKSV